MSATHRFSVVLACAGALSSAALGAQHAASLEAESFTDARGRGAAPMAVVTNAGPTAARIGTTQPTSGDLDEGAGGTALLPVEGVRLYAAPAVRPMRGVRLVVEGSPDAAARLYWRRSTTGHAGVESTVLLDGTGRAILDVAESIVDLELDVVAVTRTSSGRLARSRTLSLGATGGATPQLGTVIVDEIMKDPLSVPDAAGEWIEFFNTTSQPIDIEGWVLSDYGTDTTVLSNGGVGLIVPQRGYLVLARETNPALNGSVFNSYMYAGMTLSNGADEVVLSMNGILVDEVQYDDGVLWPDVPGASLQLSRRRLAPLWNDDGTNWCAATGGYGPNELGTPGWVNEVCP